MEGEQHIKIETTDSNCSNKSFQNVSLEGTSPVLTGKFGIEKCRIQPSTNMETFTSKSNDVTQLDSTQNNTTVRAVCPAIYEFREGKVKNVPRIKEKKSFKRHSRRKRQDNMKSRSQEDICASLQSNIAQTSNIKSSPRDDSGKMSLAVQTVNQQHILYKREQDDEAKASENDDNIQKIKNKSHENLNNNILNETFICGFNIQRIETPVSRPKLKDKLSSDRSINRSFSVTDEKPSECKLKDLRLGLGYNYSLSDVKHSSPILQSLTIQGNTVGNNEVQNDKNAQTSDVNNTKIYDASEEIDRNPKKRRRTIPSILSRSKSSPTVRELLQRSRSYARHKDFPLSEDETKTSVNISNTVESKSPVLPTTIPPKHASVNMSVNGSQVEVQGTSTLSSYSLCNKIGKERVFSRRYKNTRYTIPFKGPTIIIPKNYDAGFAKIGFIQSPSAQSSSSLILPRLTETDPVVMRDMFNSSGRVTSLPTMLLSESVSKTNSQSHQLKTQGKMQSKRSFSSLNNLQRTKSRDKRKATQIQLEKTSKAEYLPNVEKHCPGNLMKDAELSVEGKGMQDPLPLHNVSKKNTTKRDFTTLKDYHESNGRQFLTKQMSETHGVYQHPVVGKFSELLAKKQVLSPDNSHEHNSELDNSVPVPSNSTILPQVSIKKDSSIKSSSDCYFCDVEQLISNVSLQNELEQFSMYDHAYTKLQEAPTPKFQSSKGLCNSTDVKQMKEGRLEEVEAFNIVPVYAFACGEQLVLLPSPFHSGDPVTPATTPDPAFPGTHNLGDHQMKLKSLPTQGRNSKKINQRGDKRKKGNRIPKVSSSKLEFVKLVNLAPTISTKKKRTNLEKVIANIQKSKSAVLSNEKAKNFFIARVIQIERSNDNIFTQISNILELELFDGADPLLKRWQEYEDYNVRLEYDNVSGAIKRIEADSLTSGFYRIVKTGMTMSNEQETKTLATLQITLPNARTVLNDLSFIAIGKIIKDCKVKRTPANIQKHSNLEYLLHSLASLCVVGDFDSHVSDRSYLPKIHSPKWYTSRLFESLNCDKQIGK